MFIETEVAFPYHKGNRPTADLRYGGKDSISPSTSIFAAQLPNPIPLKLVYSIKLSWSTAGLLGKLEWPRVLVALHRLRFSFNLS